MTPLKNIPAYEEDEFGNIRRTDPITRPTEETVPEPGVASLPTASEEQKAEIDQENPLAFPRPGPRKSMIGLQTRVVAPEALLPKSTAALEEDIEELPGPSKPQQPNTSNAVL